MSPSLTGPGSWMPENTSSGPLGVPVPRETKAHGREAVFLPARNAPEMNGVQAHSAKHQTTELGHVGTHQRPLPGILPGAPFRDAQVRPGSLNIQTWGSPLVRSSRALAPSGVGVKGCARLLPRGGAAPS